MQGVASARLSTGVAGLDEIMHGGLIPGRTYMVRGSSGTGKTTLGVHFVIAGAVPGQKTLLITLGESEETIRQNARFLGLNLDGVSFLDLSPTPALFAEVQTYNIFHPAEVEREPITRKIVELIESLKPQRVFVDALTQFRYLATDVHSFRRQTVSFLRYLVQQGATVMFGSEYGPEAPDDDLQFVSDGVINLEATLENRTVNILKYRGSDFEHGRHSMRLTDTGMVVFPRLVPETHVRPFVVDTVPSGVPEMDELLGGGIGRGTVSIISGPAGVGKTTIGLQFMKESAGRAERSVLYSFEESVDSIVRRCEGINIPVRAMIEHGTLAIMAQAPLRISADEFANMVRREVEEKDATTVMIDSVKGYGLSLRGEDLVSHLYLLCRYLSNMRVTTLLTNEVEAITGEFRATEIGISYLADNIIVLRYIEMGGELRKAIGVLKKRTSDYEKTLRELEITRYGIKVGKPLTAMRGILLGVPEYIEPTKREGER